MADQLPNLFDSPHMAAGYAAARPALHPQILERVRRRLHLEPRDTGLDIGCGAGLSTRALQPLVRHCIGLDPSPAMIRQAAAIAPGARCLVGTAEAIPLPERSVDLITAAGSLNFARLDRFFVEAARVLRPGGVLVIYDYSEGRRFADGPELAAWYAEFLRRYPSPPEFGQDISPQTLRANTGAFRLTGHETFELGLRLAPGFYLDYILTETNVAAAMNRGLALETIRAWCSERLPACFGGREREVCFEGYFACLSLAADATGDARDSAPSPQPAIPQRP